MRYIYSTGDDFGFKDTSVHEISEGDVQISETMYSTFFEMQAAGKQFKLKNIEAESFRDMFEEFIPEEITAPKTDTQRIAELEQLVADIAALQLGV
ncbi:hypothetical protein [Paenibacillus sp. sgz5001063]|uniref:hypothetical protein n=1 Tax=Paenibacillus sp. sgz5001063 TaxID=3242474 RepID=UPI0036D33C80